MRWITGDAGQSLAGAGSDCASRVTTTVNVTVYREGETELLHFDLVRRSIKVESVYYEMKENNIGYLRITKFSDNTARDLRKGIEELTQKVRSAS